MRLAIRSAMPEEATEVISYGIPAFKHNGTSVRLAAFSKHCSLFPGASLIKAFQDELKGLEKSKGTIQFPAEEPLLSTLVKKMVKARLAERLRRNSADRRRRRATTNHSPASLLQLLLPPQHSRLVPFLLGLGDHSLFLIQDGEAGVRQNIVGINF